MHRYKNFYTSRLSLHSSSLPLLHTDLKLCHQVRWSTAVECSTADEKHVVSVDVPMLGLYCASLDDGQQIPLDSITAGVTSPPGCIPPSHDLGVESDHDRGEKTECAWYQHLLGHTWFLLIFPTMSKSADTAYNPSGYEIKRKPL